MALASCSCDGPCSCQSAAKNARAFYESRACGRVLLQSEHRERKSSVPMRTWYHTSRGRLKNYCTHEASKHVSSWVTSGWQLKYDLVFDLPGPWLARDACQRDVLRP